MAETDDEKLREQVTQQLIDELTGVGLSWDNSEDVVRLIYSSPHSFQALLDLVPYIGTSHPTQQAGEGP